MDNVAEGILDVKEEDSSYYGKDNEVDLLIVVRWLIV